MSWNQVIYEISGQYFTYLRNWFLLLNLISECLHNQIRCTRIFIKFLFQDKKWQRLQYCNFHQYQHIFAVAKWNHPYAIFFFLFYPVCIFITMAILSFRNFLHFFRHAFFLKENFIKLYIILGVFSFISYLELVIKKLILNQPFFYFSEEIS